jgi:predicted acetyltransferase
MMALDVRNPTEEELRATVAASASAFGDQPTDEQFEYHRSMLALDRIFAAYDDGRPIGLTLSHPFELTTPGGFTPAAGVTWVGVAPSHRRRGVLRELMRRQLEDTRERGEPTAILWASEAAIYGRFGYGIAAPAASLEARRDGFVLRDDPGASGAVRLVSREEAEQAFPPLYDRIRRTRPGMLSRSLKWWGQYRLADPEWWRRGAGPKFYALLERDGSAEGYAVYRMKEDWDQGFPKGETRVSEALATTPAATRELWRFLFGIDLAVSVTHFPFDVASPLFLMVVDPRRLGLRLTDGLWLRLVDVEAALRLRTYEDGDPVVIGIRDELCPWNEGALRVGASVERTDDEPDLRLSVPDLASAYLGAFTFAELAVAGRVEESRRGGLERADGLFRTAVPPWCPEVF